MLYLYNSCAVQEKARDKAILSAIQSRYTKGRRFQVRLDCVILSDDRLQDSNSKLFWLELQNRLAFGVTFIQNSYLGTFLSLGKFE